MEDETLPSGSVILWSQTESKRVPIRRKGKVSLWLYPYTPVICGNCGEQRLLKKDSIVRKQRDGVFTGLCNRCYHKLPWGLKNGKKRPAVRKLGNGYEHVFIGWGQPMTGKYGRVGAHRLVMAFKLGRPLHRNEHVHHVNGIRSDNRPENLTLLTPSEHPFILSLEARIQYLEEILTENGIAFTRP